MGMEKTTEMTILEVTSARKYNLLLQGHSGYYCTVLVQRGTHT